MYLTMPATNDPALNVERIYVRVNGKTEQISREAWDELYPGREPVVTKASEHGGEVYERNITHNLAKMASEAGCYDACWRPGEHGITHARDLIEPLRDALAALQSDPEHFKTFNPANGWGDYDSLIDFVAEYLAACERWPDAEVYASR